MIRLEKVNKYFFKGKKNQIHVIDNTDLTFDASGLVALLGPSGCGKTTLLNVIGGLDGINSGDIVINGVSIAKARAGKKDAIRNEYIGYIFQNYNLVDDMTVFDNVAVVLKMLGIKDKAEIEEKVNYVLEKVGMYRYRKRYAGMLSGGERQRVGIARAIVKNPPIIIADEPTGNLDSRNTLEVMNIIKAISRDKLVILVTHEENLANFYADRIIKIKDGSVISDEPNNHEKGLDYVMDNRIYLGDMKREEQYSGDVADVRFYGGENEKAKADIDIVVRNGNIYIRSKDPNSRVEIVDENSSMEIVEGHYREMTKEEQEAYQFDRSLLEHKAPVKYSTTTSFGEMISGGFKKVKNYSRTKKLLLVGFLVAAMFMTYAISNLMGLMTPDDKQFVTVNKDYMNISDSEMSIADYEKYQAAEGVKYAIPGDSRIDTKLVMDRYLQTASGYELISGSLGDINTVADDEIIAGKRPSSDREILVDTMALESNFNSMEGTVREAGYLKKSDLVGEKVTIGALGEFTIAGIVDRQSPGIYADSSLFQDILASAGTFGSDNEDSQGAQTKYISADALSDRFKLEGGSLPDEDYEVLINADYKNEIAIGSVLEDEINGKKLKVTGYYSGLSDDIAGAEIRIVNKKTQEYGNIQKGIKNCGGMMIYADDRDAAQTALGEMGQQPEDTYEIAKEQYMSSIKNQTIAMIVMAAVMFVISVIEIYLIMRASFLSRIREVGVYRAIGMKKRDIYRMFTGEITAITTIAGLPGLAFMCYVLYKITGVDTFADQFVFNPVMVITALVVIYGVNLIFGLLPVWRTVRKTPAQILARTDI